MTNNDETLSILLAVYNGALWLEEAIRSVMTQSYLAWELLVVDNGSEDDSFAIASRLADQDQRIKAFRLKEKGKNLAYNYAFSQSKGKFIAYFAADDILPTDSIETRMKAVIGKGPQVYSTCALKTLSDEPKYDGITMPRDVTRPNYSGGVILFSRDLAEMTFPLPLNLPNEDTWSQLHLRAFGNHEHVPESLYLYRIHGKNSFGYQVPYQIKRESFLRRMHAYELFYEKFRTSVPNNAFVNEHVRRFVVGLSALREGKIAPIITSKNFPISMKLLFLYYSSPIFYKVRMALFRLLSGRMIQT
jgi:glycosyltransferase involved in cell wall biosynthesis